MRAAPFPAAAAQQAPGVSQTPGAQVVPGPLNVPEVREQEAAFCSEQDAAVGPGWQQAPGTVEHGDGMQSEASPLYRPVRAAQSDAERVTQAALAALGAGRQQAPPGSTFGHGSGVHVEASPLYTPVRAAHVEARRTVHAGAAAAATQQAPRTGTGGQRVGVQTALSP